MANHNAKGKGLIFGEKAKSYTCKLYSWERQLVKDFIKHLREKKKKNLI